MQYLSAVLALFGTLAIAGKHHNCGCNVRGAYSEELSQATCALWGATQIHTHFDGHSCVDKGIGRGIDGQPWENTCRQAWQINFGGDPNDVEGHCWH
ncbi:hypothetical protein D6D06_06603 [Aureobasidium pullulans]|nr:hypothetical protein D6D06_06603 [Aureobasidium pullulans]